MIVSLRDREGVSPNILAYAQFALARRRWAAGERERALSDAQRAMNNYRVAEGAEEKLAELERWIAEREASDL